MAKVTMKESTLYGGDAVSFVASIAALDAVLERDGYLTLSEF